MEFQATLERDQEPRTVAIPDDLAAALAAQPGATEAFASPPDPQLRPDVRQDA